MHQFLSHLSFYFSATNQHGVHSPFVYDYITKCLYKKTKSVFPVSLDILLKSISYFNYKTIAFFGNKENTKNKIKLAYPDISVVQSEADIIFTSIEDFEFQYLDFSQPSNHTLLLVDNIHENKRNFEHWKNLKKLEKVTVTLDLFYCGAVFFRKEQVKEHFKIRI